MSTFNNDHYNKLVEFIKIHQDDFYRLAYSYVHNRDSALDIVQESIYKSLTSIDKLKNINKIKAWMFSIIINTSISFLRKNKRLIITNNIPEAVQYQNIDIADKMDLHQAIERLDMKYKTVIILRYFQGLKINEIADITGVNVNTVKSRLYSGINRLKVILNKRG
ncbi:RNA polymerase sigma factor SigV [Vallitalea longa]|uniref:RNA polymerase sigma factor SigV n=1 Tax=Vallitalea longa TaxID=2936439 RepID=A0A9W6DF63_9FIRM|nr:sigma-70 family RNA polymerase sigma factor [Vallitalea longa]GKX30240.1 RNA polymerase sigma factor SigV [Vallitalea longa]